MRPLFFLALLLGSCLAASAQAPSPNIPPTPPAAVAPASPGITKDALQQRLAELKAQYDQSIATANALQGAMVDCQYWLDQLTAQEAKAAADAKTEAKKPDAKPEHLPSAKKSP